MFVILLIFWLLLIQSVTLETLIIGVLLSAAIYFLFYRLFGITPAKELRRYPLLWYVPAYTAVLLVEVVKAGIAVLRLVFSRKNKPSPVIVKKTFDLHSEFARAVLANSITLTPGTVTVNVSGDCFTVHVLDGAQSDGLDDWILVRLLRRAERSMGI